PRDTGNPHWLREIGRAGRVDGLVFLGTRTDRVAITALAQDGVPMAHIGRREVPGCALSYVAVDNEAGVALATQHLIDHGHRRIAFYAMDLELESHRDRLAGYRHALRVAGVPFDEELVLIGATWAAGAAPSVRLPAGTTALVISDGVGWELIRALQASGTRIPEDVAIVVHNADRSIRSYDPPLTGVVTPQAELGERAAHLVIDLIEGAPSPARQQSLAPQLEIHRSCGCPIPT
ncbi:MAG: LacI family DNA-binding transcriptional regulator, partial [Chloroflexota bacterium]